MKTGANMIITYLAKSCALIAVGLMLASTAYCEIVETQDLLKAETAAPELSGLSIIECVQVLNLRTHYQVNLETRQWDPPPQYRLDLVGLQKQSIEQVLTNLLNQTGDYVFVKTNRVINVIPKNQLPDTNYVFNAVLQNYDVKEQNLVGAFEPLYRRFPQLEVHLPIDAGSGYTAKWIADEKAQAKAGPAFSLSLHDASVRAVLNEIARACNCEVYDHWVSEPSTESPPKRYLIFFYRNDEGKNVLWKHDPGLHEQMKQFQKSRGIDWP
jgi:hypothetical protein